MCLKKSQREFFRKLCENFIVKNPHFKQWTGFHRRTVYNALNRRKNGQSILADIRPGRPSSWTPSMKAKLKRLVNHRKGVSQPKLGYKFCDHQTTIGRQIQKLGTEVQPYSLKVNLIIFYTNRRWK